MSSSTANSRDAAKRDDVDSERIRTCKRCGAAVLGDHGARARHLRDECPKRRDRKTPTSSAAPSPAPLSDGDDSPAPKDSMTQLKPLPVCPTCGKLFRSQALLSEHDCPWGKRTSPTKDGKVAASSDGKATVGAGRGKVDVFNAECHALKNYDARMQRLLARMSLSGAHHQTAGSSSPTPGGAALSASQTTTRSVGSSMSFTGGAERTRCGRCGKGILTTMQRWHREACVVTKLEGKLDRVKVLVEESLGASQAKSAAEKKESFASPSDVAAEHQRLEELEAALAALSGVIAIPDGLRHATTGRLLPARLKQNLQVLDERLGEWREQLAELVDRLPPPGLASSTPGPAAPSPIPGSPSPAPAADTVPGASPPPNLRSLLHRPPADLSPARSSKATKETVRRCEALAATKSAAAQEVGDFDREILELAEMVRRGDISLDDATKPGLGMFRHNGYESAVNPQLRSSSQSAALNSSNEAV